MKIRTNTPAGEEKSPQKREVTGGLTRTYLALANGTNLMMA